MRLSILFCAFFAAFLPLSAAQQVANASGGTLQSASMSIQYNVGEPVAATLFSANQAATQGLLQPDDRDADCGSVALDALNDLIKIAVSSSAPQLLQPLANDLPPALLGALEIIEQPRHGSGTVSLAASNSQALEFRLTDFEFKGGRDTCRYRICLQDCPTVCDDALIILTFGSNVITPNDDLLNAEFDPIKTLDAASAELTIFNRWGEIVYEEKSETPKWNGKTASGHPFPQATYYYVLEPFDADGKPLPIEKGSVIVLH